MNISDKINAEIAAAGNPPVTESKVAQTVAGALAYLRQHKSTDEQVVYLTQWLNKLAADISMALDQDVNGNSAQCIAAEKRLVSFSHDWRAEHEEASHGK